MTVDLTCLVINALWGLSLVFLEISMKTRIAGTKWNLGNRDGSATPTFPAYVDRTSRALGNHKENFPLFLTAVLVVHAAGKADSVSAAAAVVYVVARLLHGLLYIAGITGVRSAVFVLGVASVLVIFSRIVL